MEKRNIRKERIGVVTSNKMEKSVIVSEVKRVKHSMYGKFVLKTKKYWIYAVITALSMLVIFKFFL